MESITRFLEKRLKLRVNGAKSAVAHVSERKFLGYRLHVEGLLVIAPQSMKRAKARIRELTRRNRSMPFDECIRKLNEFLSGWVTYFRLASCRRQLGNLDAWIRRRLRCFRLKQCKRAFAMAKFLMERGEPEWNSWRMALSGKGWWRKALTPQACHAMTNDWFDKQGLVSPTARFVKLESNGNRRGTEQVCPVV